MSTPLSTAETRFQIYGFQMDPPTVFACCCTILRAKTRTAIDTAEDMTALLWVNPKIVVEVSFVEWTRDGLLRHPEFLGATLLQ